MGAIIDKILSAEEARIKTKEINKLEVNKVIDYINKEINAAISEGKYRTIINSDIIRNISNGEGIFKTIVHLYGEKGYEVKTGVYTINISWR